MLDYYNRLKNNDIIEKIQLILFIIMIYLMCTRYNHKYDEKIIVVLGILVGVNFFIKKIYYQIDKKILGLLLVWLVFIHISFYKAKITFSTDEYMGAYKVLVLSGIGVLLVVSQLDISKILERRRLLMVINFLSLYGIYKGLIYSLKYGFFIRGDIWGGPNTYSILLGNFAVISFVSFLYCEQKIKKIIYLILNILQLFFIISVGQSRTTFCSLMFIYYIGFLLFNVKRNNLKKLLLNTLIISGIMIMLIAIINKYNLRVSEVSLEALLNNPRVGIWKKCLNDGFDIFTGKGLGYYLVGEHKFRDAVGVTIGTLHNDSLELLITQGIFSLISYWGLILTSLMVCLKKYLDSKDENNLIAIMLLIFLILLGTLETAIYVKRLIQFIFLFLAISIKGKKIKL